MIRGVAHLREFLHKYRNRIIQRSQVVLNEVDLLKQYQTVKTMVTVQRERLKMFETGRSISSEVPHGTRIHSAYQGAYGIGLVIALAYNCVLSSLYPEDIELILDSTSFVADVLLVATSVRRYKPLGSTYVALCLGAAWVGTKDPKTKAAVEKIWEDCGDDFPPGLQKPQVRELKWTERQLRIFD